MSNDMLDLPPLSKAPVGTRGSSRRQFLRIVTGASLMVGLSYLQLFTRVRSASAAPYFEDWYTTNDGPCDPVRGYARNHTENGIKCGPSAPCSSLTCCWTGATTVIGPAQHNTGNQQGWHAYKTVQNANYYQRPNECFVSLYDSWWWRFSDGRTYRCSDGTSCGYSGCFKSICPWAV